MKVNLGGERLGTGAKIPVDMHNWRRSTFNQSRAWRSTMGVGMGVPCFKEIGLNGTTFEIGIQSAGYTIPTQAPLFGEFKLQVDLFACPMRLYQGLLHNNAINIGLDMSKVLAPKITLNKTGRTSTSSLLNYLGIRGARNDLKTFGAMSILAYWDIFKNYYSNKQEENAKVIRWNETKELPINLLQIEMTRKVVDIESGTPVDSTIIRGLRPDSTAIGLKKYDLVQEFTITGGAQITLNALDGTIWGNNATIRSQGNINSAIIATNKPYEEEMNTFKITAGNNGETIGYWWKENEDKRAVLQFFGGDMQGQVISILESIIVTNWNAGIEVADFPLKNLDDARENILRKTSKTERVTINEDMNFLPYSINIDADDDTEMYKKEMNGLFLKTYLSDIYNNWLSNENIQLINEISSVNIETDAEGKPTFSMDALLLAKKVYNLLNRIAVAGGTYEDWQESVYGQKAITRAESPIYIGGTSALIKFQEVVSTASVSKEEPLGTLGGKGILVNQKGGNIVYKCNEPTLILGIASITPKIDYYQGNHWFETEIDNFDNFHKPELDGIGFQNLIANQVVWSASRETALAKQPAWLNYQTAVNEVFGYFAEPETDTKYKSLGFMVLRRDFETNEQGEITDFTTYIDPEKYNKVFAGKALTDQNFWIQLGFKCESRRVMAAYEIPSL